MIIDDFKYLARCNGLHVVHKKGYGAYRVYLKPVSTFVDKLGNTRITGKFVVVSIKAIGECDRDDGDELITRIKLQLLFG